MKISPQEFFGVHYTTVSRAIKKIEGEDEK